MRYPDMPYATYDLPFLFLAGRPGFEPGFHAPKACVLPLDDLPPEADTWDGSLLLPGCQPSTANCPLIRKAGVDIRPAEAFVSGSPAKLQVLISKREAVLAQSQKGRRQRNRCPSAALSRLRPG